MENKMTKKEMFAHIMEVNATDSAIVEFCQHEIELLSRKKSGSSKPSAKDKENARLVEVIFNELSKADRPMTISEMIKEFDELHELHNQKVNALVKKLKDTQRVERTLVKGVAYFSVK